SSVRKFRYSTAAMKNLACLWIRPRVERYVDGALRTGTARRVERHLTSCPACLTRVEDLHRLRVLVQGATAEVAEPDWAAFWPGVQARIRREAPRSGPVRDAWWLPLWRPFWGHPRLSLGGVLAAGLALGVFLWPAADNPGSTAWAGPVIVQDVAAP